MQPNVSTMILVSRYNRQLFNREMNMAARLRHPNLVQFIGASLEGEPIILTELMTTSLRAVLERGPIVHAHITSISMDVARGLNYLHLMQPHACTPSSTETSAVPTFFLILSQTTAGKQRSPITVPSIWFESFAQLVQVFSFHACVSHN